MTAAQVGSAIPQATAAQGNCISSYDSCTRNYCFRCYSKRPISRTTNRSRNCISSGNPLPVWARGAAKATEAAMANRGMSASSMAAQALAEGIMQSAIPIAAQDAATYKDMIFQNLSNNQQGSINKCTSISTNGYG